MSRARLARLFDGDSGRCLNVAVDHGFFGEPSFLTGIERMRAVVDTLIEAGPDAIQLSPGQAPLLQDRPDRGKPALVLRTDVANIYGAPPPDRLFSRLISEPVEQALRLDAACVVVNLLDIPGEPALRDACLTNALALKPACERYGLPLMVEPLALQPRGAGSGYDSDGDTERIVTLVRQAVEVGADVIKADPTADPLDYHRVVEAAGVPVLVRGGGRVADDVLLERTAAVLHQGAAGIVYGRNIIQHDDPAGITRALLAVVHEGAFPAEALTRVGGGT